jgi:curved DNA-binding protein CbpA
MTEKLPLRDPYAVLGVARNADTKTITLAYFQLVRQHPPERDAEAFKKIRAAYERVRTPERRAQTDLFLLQPPPEPNKRRSPSFDLDVHARDILTLAFRLGVAPLLEHNDFREPKLF